MFTGMIEIHDFDGPGKMQRGNPPDPRSTISLHHHPGGLSQTATHRLRIDPPTEGLGVLNGAHVGRGLFVPQVISFFVLLVLGELVSYFVFLSLFLILRILTPSSFRLA